jgi:uncharacterized protein
MYWLMLLLPLVGLCLSAFGESVAELRKKAEAGNADAQTSLGVRYNIGKGVSKDYKEAVKWFRKAAEQGHAKAQAHLGWRYKYGGGVPQDDKEAVKWFRKAAEQGYPNAQYFLGGMYLNGKGGPKDYIQAYAWWNLATANGDERVKKYRDSLEATMTPEQIAEAQELSNELHKKIEANLKAKQ